MHLKPAGRKHPEKGGEWRNNPEQQIDGKHGPSRWAIQADGGESSSEYSSSTAAPVHAGNTRNQDLFEARDANVIFT